MKCPLIHIKLTVNKTGYEGQSQDCLKEECAWWDTGPEWCVLRSSAEALVIIGQKLTDINKTMSHLEQFKRA